MGTIDYAAAPVPVRGDLAAAHRRAWEHLAGPGRYLGGAQRVAAAAEVRAAWSCTLCRERKQALSPFSVDGEHDHASASVLSDAAIDTVHRLVTDASRLSRSWVEKLEALIYGGEGQAAGPEAP